VAGSYREVKDNDGTASGGSGKGRVCAGEVPSSLYWVGSGTSAVLPHGVGELCDALLRLQKRFVGLMAGKKGRYPADPLFVRFGLLKVGDLY
jgi:hypothetical protein